MGKCRYHKKCPYYQKNSKTCNKYGGDHCGKYSEYENPPEQLHAEEVRVH